MREEGVKVLFLSPWYPDPADNGSKLRINHLVKALSEKHEVGLLALTDRDNDPPLGELGTIVERVIKCPRRDFNHNNSSSILAVFSPLPRSVSQFYDPLVAMTIEKELLHGQYDLIIASQWQMAAYWRSFLGYPSIYEELELGVYRSKIRLSKSWAARWRHKLTLWKLRYYLKRILPTFRACTVVSEVEKDLLEDLLPGYSSVKVVPNGVSIPVGLEGIPSYESKSIIFCGSLTYFANYDAVIWFLEDVYPRICETIPGVQLTITGDHANLPLPEGKNVRKTGLVENLAPYIHSSQISIAPIRIGGGTRLKILEAMAHSTPVVATGKGAEGLGAKDGKHLLIADTAQGFADCVVRLLADIDLYTYIQKEALSFVRSRYDWKNILPEFLEIIENLNIQHAPRM